MAFAVSQLMTTIDSLFKTEFVGQMMGGVSGIRRHDDDVMRAAGRTNELPELVVQTFVAKVIFLFGHPFLKAEVRFDHELGHLCPPVLQMRRVR